MSLTDSRPTASPERPQDVERSMRGTEVPAVAAGPNGPIAAATLAAGLACAVFGALVVLAEQSEGVKSALTVSEGAGPLSGKGLAATAAWVAAWAALHVAWRDRELPWHRIARATTVLVAIGLVATFPPVFQLGH